MNGLMKNFGRFGTAVFILAVIQTIILAWLVNGRVSILRSHDVVTLKSEPVDPRDLFRGDYVVLSYAISRLALDGLPGDKDLKQGDTVYVEISPKRDTWLAEGVWRKPPTPADGNKIIRGRVAGVTKNVPRVQPTHSGRDVEETPCPECEMVTLAYGIESYFVPEGQGRKLEEERNARALSVDVAIGRDGEAAIKGVRLNGNLLYEEPLF